MIWTPKFQHATEQQVALAICFKFLLILYSIRKHPSLGFSGNFGDGICQILIGTSKAPVIESFTRYSTYLLYYNIIIIVEFYRHCIYQANIYLKMFDIFLMTCLLLFLTFYIYRLWGLSCEVFCTSCGDSIITPWVSWIPSRYIFNFCTVSN